LSLYLNYCVGHIPCYRLYKEDHYCCINPIPQISCHKGDILLVGEILAKTRTKIENPKYIRGN
jgi:hypothetical protein